MNRRRALTGFVFTLPFILGFLIFTLIPFGWSIYYSLTTGLGGVEFVWLDNYIDLLNSAAFRLAALNTSRFLLIGTPILMAVSLALSLILNKIVRFGTLFGATYLYPLTVPLACLALFVQEFFSGQINREAVFGVLIGVYVWKNVGYNVVLFIAGLSGIPEEFGQAATVDGAGAFQRLRYITLPLLAPSIFFVFIISVAGVFKIFREIYAIGGADPHFSIYMLQHFLNRNFELLNYQRLSAAAFIIFAVIASLILLLFLYRKKKGAVEM
jgi:multiple sugar transport system permease protein